MSGKVADESDFSSKAGLVRSNPSLDLVEHLQPSERLLELVNLSLKHFYEVHVFKHIKDAVIDNVSQVAQEIAGKQKFTLVQYQMAAQQLLKITENPVVTGTLNLDHPSRVRKLVNLTKNFLPNSAKSNELEVATLIVRGILLRIKKTGAG